MGNSESLGQPHTVSRVSLSDQEKTLFRAASKGNLDLIKNLVRSNVDVNVKDQDGWTPLMMACSEAHGEAAVLLLAAGARVDASATSDAVTSLHLAISNAERDILSLVGYLVDESHADVNAPTSDRAWTPLMLAAHLNHCKVVSFLLSRGADVALLDLEGRSVEDIAYSGGNSAMIRLFNATEETAIQSHTIADTSPTQKPPRHDDVVADGAVAPVTRSSADDADGHVMESIPLISTAGRSPTGEDADSREAPATGAGVGSESDVSPVDRFRALMTQELVKMPLSQLKKSELLGLRDFITDLHGELDVYIEQSEQAAERELDKLDRM